MKRFKEGIYCWWAAIYHIENLGEPSNTLTGSAGYNTVGWTTTTEWYFICSRKVASNLLILNSKLI